MNRYHPVKNIFLVFFALPAAVCLTEVDSVFSAESATVIGVGKKVSIQYTLSREDKSEIESNVGKDPLTYTHGSGDILPGLEAGLLGLKVGEEKTITLKPKEAYGEVNPEALLEVKIELVPETFEKWANSLSEEAHPGRCNSLRLRR